MDIDKSSVVVEGNTELCIFHLWEWEMGGANYLNKGLIYTERSECSLFEAWHWHWLLLAASMSLSIMMWSVAVCVLSLFVSGVLSVSNTLDREK